jgi:hypothetical protein
MYTRASFLSLVRVKTGLRYAAPDAQVTQLKRFEVKVAGNGIC